MSTSHNIFRSFGLRISSLISVLGLLGVSAPQAALAHGTSIRQTVGQYSAEMMFPNEPPMAGEIGDGFLFIRHQTGSEAAGSDFIPVSKATCSVTMPEMPGMPAMTPQLKLDTPGKYTFSTSFPHGGKYRFEFKITLAQESKPLIFSLPINILDMAQLNAERPYLLRLDSDPFYPDPGQPVDLKFAVWQASPLKALTAFDTVHEKKMHLIIVSTDLTKFYHVHPTLHPDGTFTYRFAFPSPGTWHLFCEVSPTGGGTWALLATQYVKGDPTATQASLVPSDKAVYDDGIKVTLDPAPQTARKTSKMHVKVTDLAGKPLQGLQPWLAAPAHLTLIEQDSFTFIHSHPADPLPGSKAAKTTPGDFTFMVRFPKAGTYKGWLQFQRDNVVHTVPFVIGVKDTVSQTPRTAAL